MPNAKTYNEMRSANLDENRRMLQELGVRMPHVGERVLFNKPKPPVKHGKEKIAEPEPDEDDEDRKSNEDRKSDENWQAGNRTSFRVRLKTKYFHEDDDYVWEAPKARIPQVRPDNFYGSVPGIEVGREWATRMECSADLIHRPTVAGIHRGPDGAYSVALSGGYEDDVDFGESFTYTGEGGRDLKGTANNPKNLRTAPQSKDQVLERGNEALAVSVSSQKPVRVVRGYKLNSQYAPESGYRYDGLYQVKKFWAARGKSGFKVFKFAFVRCDPDPAPWTNIPLGRDFGTPTSPSTPVSIPQTGAEACEAPSLDADDSEDNSQLEEARKGAKQPDERRSSKKRVSFNSEDSVRFFESDSEEPEEEKPGRVSTRRSAKMKPAENDDSDEENQKPLRTREPSKRVIKPTAKVLSQISPNSEKKEKNLVKKNTAAVSPKSSDLASKTRASKSGSDEEETPKKSSAKEKSPKSDKKSPAKTAEELSEAKSAQAGRFRKRSVSPEYPPAEDLNGKIEKNTKKLVKSSEEKLKKSPKSPPEELKRSPRFSMEDKTKKSPKSSQEKLKKSPKSPSDSKFQRSPKTFETPAKQSLKKSLRSSSSPPEGKSKKSPKALKENSEKSPKSPVEKRRSTSSDYPSNLPRSRGRPRKRSISPEYLPEDFAQLSKSPKSPAEVHAKIQKSPKSLVEEVSKNSPKSPQDDKKSVKLSEAMKKSSKPNENSKLEKRSSPLQSPAKKYSRASTKSESSKSSEKGKSPETEKKTGNVSHENKITRRSPKNLTKDSQKSSSVPPPKTKKEPEKDVRYSPKSSIRRYSPISSTDEESTPDSKKTRLSPSNSKENDEPVKRKRGRPRKTSIIEGPETKKPKLDILNETLTPPETETLNSSPSAHISSSVSSPSSSASGSRTPFANETTDKTGEQLQTEDIPASPSANKTGEQLQTEDIPASPATGSRASITNESTDKTAEQTEDTPPSPSTGSRASITNESTDKTAELMQIEDTPASPSTGSRASFANESTEKTGEQVQTEDIPASPSTGSRTSFRNEATDKTGELMQSEYMAVSPSTGSRTSFANESTEMTGELLPTEDIPASSSTGSRASFADESIEKTSGLMETEDFLVDDDILEVMCFSLTSCTADGRKITIKMVDGKWIEVEETNQVFALKNKIKDEPEAR